MADPLKPSRFTPELAVLLDDNVAVPVAQALTLMIAVGLVTINLLVDLTYFLIDPRVTVTGGPS